MGGNIGDNIGGNMGGNSGDISINNKYTESLRNPKRNTDEDQEEEDRLARARAEREVETAWRRCFGKKAPPALVSALVWRGEVFEFGEHVLEKAIELTAQRCSGSPYEYAVSVLADWGEKHIHSLEEAEEYIYLRDEGGDERLRAFCEDRQTAEERQALEDLERERREAAEARRRQIDLNREAREARERKGAPERPDAWDFGRAEGE